MSNLKSDVTDNYKYYTSHKSTATNNFLSNNFLYYPTGYDNAYKDHLKSSAKKKEEREKRIKEIDEKIENCKVTEKDIVDYKFPEGSLSYDERVEKILEIKKQKLIDEKASIITLGPGLFEFLDDGHVHRYSPSGMWLSTGEWSPSCPSSNITPVTCKGSENIDYITHPTITLIPST